MSQNITCVEHVPPSGADLSHSHFCCFSCESVGNVCDACFRLSLSRIILRFLCIGQVYST